MRDRWLAVTIVTAVLVLICTSTAVLFLDQRVTSAEALRTGGLAAGSVVALYALWLNDRRLAVGVSAEIRKSRLPSGWTLEPNADRTQATLTTRHPMTS